MSTMTINKLDEMLSEFRLIDIQMNDRVKVIYSKYETWRTIKNYDNYSVSSFGRVRNDDTDRILKPLKRGAGYYYIDLSKNGKKKQHNIHRLVAIGFSPNHENKPKVDHIDEIKTNNNIINLRFATVSQNGYNQDKQKNNKSGFKGVSFDKCNQKYKAFISIKGKQTYLGSFQSAEDASKVYEENAKKLHGEFYYKNNK